MDPRLIIYYEAIERASADMLAAARTGDWQAVVKLEGACVLLINQLKHAADGVANGLRSPAPEMTMGLAQHDPHGLTLESREADRAKTRIMRRILVNDAHIRNLAEPWLSELDQVMAGERRTLH